MAAKAFVSVLPASMVAGLSPVTALLHVEFALLVGTADGELLLLD